MTTKHLIWIVPVLVFAAMFVLVLTFNHHGGTYCSTTCVSGV